MTEPRWLNADERRAWLAQVSINTLLPAALDTQLHHARKLSLFDYNVLAMLSEADGRFLPMSELAARTSASLSRLSHVVTKLQTGAGWSAVRTPAMPGSRRRTSPTQEWRRSWNSPRPRRGGPVAVPRRPERGGRRRPRPDRREDRGPPGQGPLDPAGKQAGLRVRARPSAARHRLSVGTYGIADRQLPAPDPRRDRRAQGRQAVQHHSGDGQRGPGQLRHRPGHRGRHGVRDR